MAFLVEQTTNLFDGTIFSGFYCNDGLDIFEGTKLAVQLRD